ncbi:MAG: hypothetical protein HYY90_01455 [Candidatus Omnitrophica bacterium]|nr:hypothetical protein [Candidatus Omnitrophota bacterium]MBI2495134.1 hypothetical protein [Candidatus Omnitrophota bacterium]MBI3021987.1 hypothetical protein [Candidatus Omnitrophota bacterium]MBI3083022.1 hypothetical protein [Candidatus Omnitrophota bacterium]
MKQVGALGIAVLTVILSGCESMGTAAQSKTTQGAVLGGLLGAGTGAIIGNQSDHAGAGTAIGAGLGALSGGLIGRALEENEKKAQQQATPPATARTKFCPVGGELYGEDVKYCPSHGVELKYKE